MVMKVITWQHWGVITELVVGGDRYIPVMEYRPKDWYSPVMEYCPNLKAYKMNDKQN